jgi:hypothetical protein
MPDHSHETPAARYLAAWQSYDVACYRVAHAIDERQTTHEFAVEERAAGRETQERLDQLERTRQEVEAAFVEALLAMRALAIVVREVAPPELGLGG